VDTNKERANAASHRWTWTTGSSRHGWGHLIFVVMASVAHFLTEDGERVHDIHAQHSMQKGGS